MALAVGDLGERCVDRVLIIAVDVDLLHHRERHAVGGGAEGLDLLGAARLLAAELVAREPDDGEAAIGVLLVQCFEPGVLRGESALRRDVHGEDRLAVEGGEAGGVAGEGVDRFAEQ